MSAYFVDEAGIMWPNGSIFTFSSCSSTDMICRAWRINISLPQTSSVKKRVTSSFPRTTYHRGCCCFSTWWGATWPPLCRGPEEECGKAAKAGEAWLAVSDQRWIDDSVLARSRSVGPACQVLTPPHTACMLTTGSKSDVDTCGRLSLWRTGELSTMFHS